MAATANTGEPEKGLNLQSFQSVASLIDHRDKWDEVVVKLRGSEMPPIEEERRPKGSARPWRRGPRVS